MYSSSRLNSDQDEIEIWARIIAHAFFRFGLASSVLPGSNPQAVIRHLPIDMSLILWQVVFSQREPAILAKWLSFHETVQPVRGITEDTWDLFLPFALSVRY